MYMLAGLKTIFLQALNNDLNDKPYSKLLLIERWNKECDKVYEYKNEIAAEMLYKTATKTGTWEHSTRGFDVPGDYECSICHSPSGVKHFYNGSKYTYCPDCGARLDN